MPLSRATDGRLADELRRRAWVDRSIGLRMSSTHSRATSRGGECDRAGRRRVLAARVIERRSGPHRSYSRKRRRAMAPDMRTAVARLTAARCLERPLTVARLATVSAACHALCIAAIASRMRAATEITSARPRGL